MVLRPYYRALSEETILWAHQVWLCCYEMEETTMTRPESSDRIQNLQITNQERCGPRMHMRIPMLLLHREGKTVHTRVVHCLQDHVTRLAKVGLEFVEDGRSFWDFPGTSLHGKH